MDTVPHSRESRPQIGQSQACRKPSDRAQRLSGSLSCRPQAAVLGWLSCPSPSRASRASPELDTLSSFPFLIAISPACERGFPWAGLTKMPRWNHFHTEGQASPKSHAGLWPVGLSVISPKAPSLESRPTSKEIPRGRPRVPWSCENSEVL